MLSGRPWVIPLVLHLLLIPTFHYSRKKRRESRKNSSFEDSNGDLQIKHESTSFVHEDEQENQEVEVDGSESVIIEDVIIDESDMVVEEAEESEIHDLGQEMYFSGDVENHEEVVVIRYDPTPPMHSYPRATSPPRRRPKAKRGVDKMIQADVGEEEEEEIIGKSTNVIQLVDMGTQVCERDLLMVDAGC